MSGKFWIGVDLDGTLAYYDRYRGDFHIGRPIPKMIRRVQTMLARGDTIKVFTARVAPAEDRDVDAIKKVIASWTYDHIGVALDSTCMKDTWMVRLYDDKAVQVQLNTGRIVAMKDKS